MRECGDPPWTVCLCFLAPDETEHDGRCPASRPRLDNSTAVPGGTVSEEASRAEPEALRHASGRFPPRPRAGWRFGVSPPAHPRRLASYGHEASRQLAL